MIQITRDPQNDHSIYWLTTAPVFLQGVFGFTLPWETISLSRLCILFMQCAIIWASLRLSLSVKGPIRLHWRLLALGVLFRVGALALDEMAPDRNIPIFSHPAIGQTFLATLFFVPFLFAISVHFDSHVHRPVWLVNAGISLATAGMLHVWVVAPGALNGSGGRAAPFLPTLFGALDIFLLIGSMARAWGAKQPEKRFFFYVVSCFFGADAILMYTHNQIHLNQSRALLDLLMSVPYLLLLLLIRNGPPNRLQHYFPPAVVVRNVRGASPIFQSLALLILGVAVSRNHFAVGVAGILVSVLGYGTLNIMLYAQWSEDEAALKDTQKILEKLVGVDALTSISNRRAFDHMFANEFRAACRSAQPLSLLMIDVDFFKELNDTQGHSAGDMCLVNVAEILREVLVRSTDMAFRYGGDEFTAILPATNQEGARLVAERVHEAVRKRNIKHTMSPFGRVTVSVGYSTFQGPKESVSAGLLEAADSALYKSKQMGRDCVAWEEIEAQAAA